MIVTLNEAQVVKSNVTVSDLTALEAMVRSYTNNNFINLATKTTDITTTGNTVLIAGNLSLFIEGDTVQLFGTGVNDGFYTVKSVSDAGLSLETKRVLVSGTWHEGGIARVDYPADVKNGVLKMLAYEAATSDKIGIKSETVGRMSTTYYDNTASESIEGFPAAYLNFLKKYRKIRWS